MTVLARIDNIKRKFHVQKAVQMDDGLTEVYQGVTGKGWKMRLEKQLSLDSKDPYSLGATVPWTLILSFSFFFFKELP